MPAGTAWASSEWAKLAFQDLIFPPDMNKIKVPWLMPAQRKTAIFDALEMKAPSSSQDAQPTITPATDPYAEPGRPGGMNTPPPAPPRSGRSAPRSARFLDSLSRFANVVRASGLGTSTSSHGVVGRSTVSK